jgi:glucosamine-6-phosphate deaminase
MNPLRVTKEKLGLNSPIPLAVLKEDTAVIQRFADDLMSEYLGAKEAGRQKVVFIVPVGPVGQYDIWAERCNAEGLELHDLVLINMDEYLTEDGHEFIPLTDPLSFRKHMQAHFIAKLAPELAPPPDQLLFPDPKDSRIVPRAIERYGGCDVCFGGVGITGHVAFNDPPEPGETIPLEVFKELPTRVVRLSRETRLINSITTSRGNIDRIPELAVTVGMKEILESRKVRIYMNRTWQSAIVRKILHGPVTPAVPASLLQGHPDVRFTIAEYVAEIPEPRLK